MSVGGFLWYLGAFAVALGILIVVHEFGHFAAARLCGVKVLRFSVGFGRPLLMRRWGRDGTEWLLAAFPLGGYVKMLDEREGEVPADELPRAFNRQSIGRRSLIVVAGPLANLMLAVALYWGIYLHGTEEPRPVLGAPVAGSIAEKAGIGERQAVRAVAGKAVTTWQDLRWELVRRAVDREPVKLEVAAADGAISFPVFDLSGLAMSALEGDLLRELGLTLYRPRLPAVIGRIAAGSAAAGAGVSEGDEVLAVDGQPIGSWRDLAMAIRQAPGRPLNLEIRRGDDRREINVTPSLVSEGGQTIGRIGIAAPERPDLHAEMFVTVRLGPIDALARAVEQT